MKVNELSEKIGLTVLTMPNPNMEVHGGYTGDMPSWVMGRANPGSLWITIMNNENILAVASLLELSGIVLVDGSNMSDDLIALAEKKGINLFCSEKSAFYLSAEIAGIV